MDAYTSFLYAIQNTKTGKLFASRADGEPWLTENLTTAKEAHKLLPSRKNYRVVKISVVYTVLDDKV